MTQALVQAAPFSALEPIEGERRELFAKQILENATPAEVAVCVEICHRLQLDPFRRQIHFAKKGGRMLTMIGIDGHRAIADRTGLYEGQAPVQWCGPDGQWVDIWLSNGAPAAARVAIYRKGFREPVVAVARTRSYAKGGNWNQMPDVMIAKCAEALAIRKAFPQHFGGIYATEEISAVQDDQVAGPAEPPAPGVHKMQPKPKETEVEDAEVIDSPTAEELISSFVDATSMAHLNALTPDKDDVAHLSDDDKAKLRQAWEACRDALKPPPVPPRTEATKPPQTEPDWPDVPPLNDPPEGL
jgi:phage recombination protein Bet